MNSKVEVIETSPGLHPVLQLLQHAAHVRTARSGPFRIERILADIDDIYHHPPDPLDLRGRRQPGARPGARDGALRRHHRPQLPGPESRRPGRLPSRCPGTRRWCAKMAQAGFKVDLPGDRKRLQEKPEDGGQGRHRRGLAPRRGPVPQIRHHGGGRADVRVPGRRRRGHRRELPVPEVDRGRHALLPDPDALSENRHARVPAGRGAGDQPGRFHRATTACGPT